MQMIWDILFCRWECKLQEEALFLLSIFYHVIFILRMYLQEFLISILNNEPLREEETAHNSM